MGDHGPTAAGLPVVELEGIDVPSPVDPELVLLADVDWRVCDGDRWLVSGPPGTGKSSVLHAAAGLVRPSRGRHRLFGADLANLGEREQVELRSRIGVVFGGSGRLFSHLNVAENLALPLLYHARRSREAPWHRLEQVAEGLGLAAYAKRAPRELPRRIASRVALARALMLAPEVLLLDDPAGGLPAAETEWWRGFVADCARGRGLVDPPPRTLVIAAQDEAAWRDLVDCRASVGEGVWQARRGVGPADPGLRRPPGQG